MNKIHTQLTAQIEVLSPLHVSSGNKLQKGFDWLERNNKLFVVDQDAMFDLVLQRAEKERGADVAAITTRLMEMTLSDLLEAGWLTAQDFAPDSPICRYVLHGRSHMNELSEQIKDVYGRPYLPGSSLKGALRTMLAFAIYTEQKQQPDLRGLKPSRSWAAQSLERAIFGRDPNHDLLRALHVSDSPSLDPDCLQLVGVQVFPTARRGQSGLALDIEAIRPGTQFAVPVTIDEYGFRDDIATQLGWQNQRQWLENLAKFGQEHARQRLVAEVDYLKQKNAPRPTQLFYHQLINTHFANLKANEFILQIGWGAGWDSKTLSGLLKQNERVFARLVKDYRLQGRSRRPYQPGDLFPASRKLVLRGGKTAEPLGWIKITLTGG
ncbi:MAG: type III-A CRISPR-associated RAMP protein Csm5 [Chloroflexi bacterium]|nr:MAG: type III-A CRISPR-associated RAMP protein Csm5 [Chloroflexota bacterium]